MPFALLLICVLLVSYLLGSLPSGVVISHLVYHTDVRDYGSGNIGTTNSFRALGKVGGSIVFLMDFFKGFIATLVAWALCQWLMMNDPLNTGSYQVIMALSFLGVVSGHIYCPWLRFKGGKGIATAVGALFFVFGPWLTLLELALFAVLVIVTKKVSVGSIAAAILCPVLALYVFWGNWLAWLIISITAVMVLYAHRANIERLRNHTESTIGSGKASGASAKDETDSSENADREVG